ncbi:MAG: hypothetical protein HY900_04315 [Deltaproteobacteria bacterium]|nr:hypothetical protein [Deltaproteobacteria bacterium]
MCTLLQPLEAFHVAESRPARPRRFPSEAGWRIARDQHQALRRRADVLAEILNGHLTEGADRAAIRIGRDARAWVNGTSIWEDASFWWESAASEAAIQNDSGSCHEDEADDYGLEDDRDEASTILISIDLRAGAAALAGVSEGLAPAVRAFVSAVLDAKPSLDDLVSARAALDVARTTLERHPVCETAWRGRFAEDKRLAWAVQQLGKRAARKWISGDWRALMSRTPIDGYEERL